MLTLHPQCLGMPYPDGFLGCLDLLIIQQLFSSSTEYCNVPSNDSGDILHPWLGNGLCNEFFHIFHSYSLIGVLFVIVVCFSSMWVFVSYHETLNSFVPLLNPMIQCWVLYLVFFVVRVQLHVGELVFLLDLGLTDSPPLSHLCDKKIMYCKRSCRINATDQTHPLQTRLTYERSTVQRCNFHR